MQKGHGESPDFHQDPDRKASEFNIPHYMAFVDYVVGILELLLGRRYENVGRRTWIDSCEYRWKTAQ